MTSYSFFGIIYENTYLCKENKVLSVLVRRREIAINLDIPPSTVKHYIDLRLFEPASKTTGGQYLFDFEEVSKRYEMISKLKKKRLSLKDIKEEVDMAFGDEKADETLS